MEIFPYLDPEGYPGTVDPGTKEWDGGDTAAILGTFLALQKTTELPSGLLFALADADGRPRRHPNTMEWYGQSDRFSRDQLIPIICAGIRLKQHVTVDVIADNHKQKWYLTAWNTKKNGVMVTPDKFPDITGPEIWALWLRYFQPSWAWVFVWLLDIETLVGSILWRLRGPKNRVTRNHMLVCKMGMKVYPTVTMRLANWINDWPELMVRWRAHCMAVGECPSADLFVERP